VRIAVNRKVYADADQTLVKAFDLLKALSEDNVNSTAQLLARKLKISSNKLFQITETLEIMGIIDCDKNTGIYRLGLCTFGMARQILKSSSILSLAQPTLEDLARKHDEAVYLTIVNNDEVVFLDMVDSFQPVKAATFIGRRFPLFTNAAGKVIQAMSSSDVLEKFYKKRAVKSGVNDLLRLKSELEDIRRSGVAVDNNCLAEGVCSVAVAIKDYAGMVVGAITLLGPTFRMMQDRLEKEIIPSMLEMSEELSTKFGYGRIPV
jgi:DNA-binding IclR family transcriptional regulator